MRQFFEAYEGEKKVSALLTQLSSTHHPVSYKLRLKRVIREQSPKRIPSTGIAFQLLRAPFLDDPLYG
jgi:hypothetical protein